MVSFNGQKVYNLSQLVQLVDGCAAEYLTFDLDYNQKVVLRAGRAKAATAEVLETHCIPSDRSADLEAGPAANGAAAAGKGKRAAAGKQQQQKQQEQHEQEPAAGGASGSGRRKR